MAQSGWTIRFKGYLPVDDRMEDRLRRVMAEIDRVPDSALHIDEAACVITVDYGEVRGWLEESRRLLRTVRAGERIVVKPPWEEYCPQPGDVVLEIDPGVSFGSGLHETTSLCLEALERHLGPGSSVVDFGTGSGILAICAAKLGASRVAAIEADLESADAAREDVARNGLAGVVEVIYANDLSPVAWQADLISANIVAGTIISHLAEFARVLKRGGLLIASGMTKRNAQDVERALPGEGFAVVERLTRGGWVALVTRSGGAK